MSDIDDRVKRTIVEKFGVAENLVVGPASLVDDLELDSLDLVELVMAFEEEFGIDVPDNDAESIKTVQDVVDYIKRY